MDRLKVIEKLTRDELIFLHENFSEENLRQLVEFFMDGGFDSWSDKELKNKFDTAYGEENA